MTTPDSKNVAVSTVDPDKEEAGNKEEKKEEEKKEEEKEEEKVEDKGGLKRIGREFGSKHSMFMILGYLFSLANGTIMPFFGIAFREVLEILTSSYDAQGNPNFSKEAPRIIWIFVAMGTGALVLTLGQYLFWGLYGTRVAIDIRKRYFELMLDQEISYHDEKTAAKLNSNITTECTSIENGIGIKYGFAMQQVGATIFGIVMAFYYSWMLSLVLVGLLPVLLCIGAVQGALFASSGGDSDVFMAAGSFTQEVLTNVRTVVSFPPLADHKAQQFTIKLNEAFPIFRKRSLVMGVGLGLFMSGIFCVYGVGLYSGARFVDKGWISVGDLFGSYFTFIFAGMGLGQLTSVIPDLQKATLGANKFYMLMERKPLIRPPDRDTALKPKQKIRGEIEFRNVSFAYSTNEDQQVLRNISFTVRPGTTCAIVGPSGSGKSTIMSLLERFYDPTEGEILIDGESIHNYDIEYIRSQIGLVSQMPLLFDASVAENILGGHKEVSDEDVIAAAKIANAHDFITDLPKGYETSAGEMGSLLSGGQRQRVAIARAMLAQPSILLLDEATAALDSKSEQEVQVAIDKISSARDQTVIAIAHRLSTIQNADQIIVIVDGLLREMGDHQHLIQLDGIYAALVNAQTLVEEKTEFHRQRSSERFAAADTGDTTITIS